MNCRRVSDLLPRYVDGDLAGRDLAELQQHLQECRACHEQLQLNGRLAGMLAGLPTPAGAAAAEARITERVLAEVQRPRRSGTLWRAALSLGNAAALAAVGAIAVLLVLSLAVTWRPLLEGRFGAATPTVQPTREATPTASSTPTVLPAQEVVPTRGATQGAVAAGTPAPTAQPTPTTEPTATAQPTPATSPTVAAQAQPAVRSLVVTPDEPPTLYAVIGSRLYRSTDRGRSWLEEDCTGLPVGAEINGLAIDYRHPDTMYALTARGIYRRDGRDAWGLVNTLQAATLAVDLQDSSTLWAGVRRGELDAVILKSTDGGRTWGKADWGVAAQAEVASGILVDPRNPNVLWAVVRQGGQGPAHIWRGGRDGHWERLNLGPFEPFGRGSGVTGIAYDPNANLLFAGTLLGGDDRAAPAALLLRSPNAGAADSSTVRWEEAGRFSPPSAGPHGEVRPLAVDAREPKSLFATLSVQEAGQAAAHRLLVSHDGGATWDTLALDRLAPRQPSTPGRIAFVQSIWDPGCAAPSCGRSHVFTMHADGSHVVDLTPEMTGNSNDPACSPDGQRIAFLSDHEAGRQANSIYIVHPDGSGLARISDRSFFQTYGPLYWSADGQRVALRYPGDGLYYVYSVAGQNLGSLSELSPEAWAFPNHSPDGRYRAEYQVADPAKPWLVDLYLYASDATQKVNLTGNPFERPRQLPSWSPDGQSIVFAHGNGGIYAVSADGSAWMKLSDGHAPSWLPQGP